MSQLAIGCSSQQANLHRLLMYIQSSAVGVEDFHFNAPVLFFRLMQRYSGLDGEKRRFTSRVLLVNIRSPAQQGVVPAPTRISLVVWFFDTRGARSLVSEHLLLFYSFSLGVV
jgi:hypothetical protein